MHSQFGEDDVVAQYFGDRVGTFLDIGAYDGCTFSNTYRFVQAGWRGVLIEPSPTQFLKLLDNLGENPNLQLIMAAVSTKAEVAPFWHELTFQSTLSESFRNEYTHLNWLKKWHVWTMPASAIPFCEYDYISVDTEGNDLEICYSMIHLLRQAKALCVEHGKKNHDQWLGLFSELGMRVLATTELNYVAAL